MSGTPVRVAVQEGAGTVRIAGAEADGAAWLIAELPAPGPGVAALLAELVGPAPEELLLVHPGRWPVARAARWAGECGPLAAQVRAVPAPLAAAGWGGVAVLDVGTAGAEATLLGPDGRVRAWATADAGGRRLDELLGARWGWHRDTARGVREALSLLPEAGGVEASDLAPLLAGPLGEAVRALRDVLTGAGPVPVLLVGGVARSPLLARLVDEAGIGDAAVAPRPDAAAVLGALALPRGPATREVDVVGPSAPAEPHGAEVGSRCESDVAARADEPPALRRLRRGPDGWEGAPGRAGAAAGHRLPPLPPRRRRPARAALLTVAVAAAAALLLAAGRLVAPPAAEPPPAGVLVQYGYRLDVPAGWEHTGGLPERRRVLLTPVAAPEGSDLIAVERSPLGYDTAAEPERAQAELRAAFDAAVTDGSALSGYDPGARFGGRPVTSYRQEDGHTAVEWFVVLDGDAQLSVGCRHTAAGTEAVRAACSVVVGSVGGA